VFTKGIGNCPFLRGRELGHDPRSVIESKRELPAVQISGTHLASQLDGFMVGLFLQS
jgi:hypothetical protein